MTQNQEKFSFHSLVDPVYQKNQSVEIIGLHDADKAYLISKLCAAEKRPMLLIAPSEKAAEACTRNLDFFMKHKTVRLFPCSEPTALNFLSSYHEASALRIRTLYEITTEESPIIVSCAKALSKKVIPKQELIAYAELILEGEEINREALLQKLTLGGYAHTAIVEEPGDFCVRGGILDMFSPLYPDPIRIEFFGDTVESLRFFSAATQRKLKNIREAVILPVKEYIESAGTLFDYLPDQAIIIMDDPGESESSLEPEQWGELKQSLEQKQTILLKNLSVSDAPALHLSVQDNSTISLEIRTYPDKEARLSPLADWIRDKQSSGLTTVMVCSTQTQAERTAALLRLYEIQSVLSESFSDIRLGKNVFHICKGQLSSGFVWADESLAIITEDEVFGKKQHRKKQPVSQDRLKAELLSLEDLKKGDLIVHAEQGIGRYQGLEKIGIEGIVNDFLLIVYRDDDKLYVPVDRMSMVQKYMGVDESLPMLDKMGGKTWEKVREKVRKSVEKIAGELLKLYAERKIVNGHAFSPPDNYFRDFEAGFPYEETEDQLKTIEAVLEDMRSETPMDRLVCGDVGYGKTEIALRAAFIAVSDSKQAAILVPTTILAEQHFETFSSRFHGYPVKLACLNRFRSSKEQKEIIKGLETGNIDIVIGTHRLLQKDVNFKDLGLIVIDEEHRFGVKHKEKLKKLRSSVDVLALTATPIPRTLHLSLSGIRDISLITTPPEDRKAIVTYVCQFNKALISDAIRKELARKGQIFFVHNTIRTIPSVAMMLQNLVPELRLDIAHGQLGEDELEKVMRRFVKHEIDLLLCTTIIESGLDIPAANTMMINRADRFGLAQIYQLRGRVGRGDEQAYSYLFIPNENALTKDAQKRLKVLMEHSDLGAGFQIAMNDLKIRGGGTILGASQSGHIAAVGYDMFLQLMENAIAEYKGEEVKTSLEPEINMQMSALIPESYIPDIDQRLGAYRRLTKMTDLKEISDFKDELTDRFGNLPEEAVNLLMKIMLRVMCIKAGVKRLDLVGQQLSLRFSESHQKNPMGIVKLVTENPSKFEFSPDQVLKTRVLKTNSKALVEIKGILKEIIHHVDSSGQ